MAARQLAVYSCSEPVPVVPRHGRSWLMEITLPYAQPSPEIMSTVLQAVWGFDGECHGPGTV